MDLAALGEPVSTETQMLVCGFAAVVGHCYPVWHSFRGGKGAATAVGALLLIEPMAVPLMLLTWLLVLVVTGWVGLGTMLAAWIVVPVFVWLGASVAQIVFGVVLALFITFMHRTNITNMLNDSEYRFQRIRMVNWFR